MMSALRNKLREERTPDQYVSGRWRTIRYCFDEDAGEFFNVGVVFTSGKRVEVRMLDTFDRLTCLFDKRIHTPDLERILHSIEDSILEIGSDLPPRLGENIVLGDALYASGADAESIADTFYQDMVTLGRPKSANRSAFRYRTTRRVLDTISDHLRETMPLAADRIIQQERFPLTLKTGNKIPLDIPLIGEKASGTVVSAWYKSPIVVENNLLSASADLQLMRTNSDRTQAALSVLIPDEQSGLTAKELDKLTSATRRQLDRIDASGIEIIESHATIDLARRTAQWWEKLAS